MKILLSSPIAPLPSFVDGRDNLHNNYANTTYGQGIFSVPVETHAYGLHLIAQNISADTTVLESPTAAAFEAEVARGYDFVGIHFLMPFFSKAVEMCRIVRRRAPGTRIVLGGHGVQCFAHNTGREEELLGLADHVCRGEGVRFMRTLLGDDVSAPIAQDLPLAAAVPFGVRALRQRVPVLVGTLGCPNRCEFCASSAFFDGRRVELAGPSEVFAAIQSYLRRYDVSTAHIYDDNLLLNRRFVRELGRLIRNDPLCRARSFGYYTFASVNAVARYDLEELVSCGVQGLFIGVESMFTEKLDDHVARKKRGFDTRKVFQGLLDHGIRIDGSMILGWDFHDAQTIQEDIDAYVSLGASSDQIVALLPAPETALWSRLLEEGRLSSDIDWDEAGFYSRWMRYKNFTHEELWAYEDRALRKAYETWGPGYLRNIDVSLRGWRTLVDHPDPYLRSRAEYHKQRCWKLYPLLRPMRAFAPNERVRALTDEAKRGIRDAFGPPSARRRLESLAALGIGGYCKLRNRLVREDTSQPRSQRFHYGPQPQLAEARYVA